jgi:GGDEF domain-containing protein
MTLYHYILLAALLTIGGLLMLIRHLAVDPGFNIWTRAAGDLSLHLAYPLRHSTLIYGDVDSLGKINDALTLPGVLGHDRFNGIMRRVLCQMRGTDRALVYGGDELRLLVPVGVFGGRRAEDNARALCRRFQTLLRNADLLIEERQQLQDATGYDHIRITLAYAADVRYTERRRALGRLKAAVGQAKPKSGPGKRGQVLPC